MVFEEELKFRNKPESGYTLFVVFMRDRNSINGMRENYWSVFDRIKAKYLGYGLIF